MDCKRCNGIGHLWIRSGDSDEVCPECGGSGNAPHSNLVAEEAELSVEALVRLELAAYDEAHTQAEVNFNTENYERSNELYLNLGHKAIEKYRSLLDIIEAQRKENERLAAALSTIEHNAHIKGDSDYAIIATQALRREVIKL